jgi:hypothetical protein
LKFVLREAFHNRRLTRAEFGLLLREIRGQTRFQSRNHFRVRRPRAIFEDDAIGSRIYNLRWRGGLTCGDQKNRRRVQQNECVARNLLHNLPVA